MRELDDTSTGRCEKCGARDLRPKTVSAGVIRLKCPKCMHENHTVDLDKILDDVARKQPRSTRRSPWE